MKALNILLSLTVLMMLGSCAKERPIEKRPDPEKERLYKPFFTGSLNIVPLSGKKQQGTVWLAKTTVTKTSEAGGFAFVGWQSDVKAGYFDFTKDSLRFYSAVTPYERGGAFEDNLINSWSITHSEHRLRESDGKVTNVEEEDAYKRWDQKRFFKINWASSKIKEAASFPYRVAMARMLDCWVKADANLVPESLETSEDYISFTIRTDYVQVGLCAEEIRKHIRGMFSYTADYTYSFKKLKETGYSPYVYTGEDDPLMSKYGYFQTVVESINPGSGRLTNDIVMNRWAPNKTHTYYFSDGYPKRYKWIFNDPKHGVIAKTNKLFERNGLKTRFKIEDANGKKFGDLRYSFINMVQELSPNAPAGYGPSDANPFTGEIVAANITLWVGYLKFYLQFLADQIEHEKDRYAKSSIFREMTKTLEQPNTAWTSTAASLKPGTKAGEAFHALLPEFTFGYPGWARFTGHSVYGNSLSSLSGSRDFPGAVGDIPTKVAKSSATVGREIFRFQDLKELEELISRDRGAAIEALKATQQWARRAIHEDAHRHVRDTTVYAVDSVLSDGMKMLLDGKSPQRIIDTILYRLALHEFGHTLGLRHNFYGSVDIKNMRSPILAYDEKGEPILEKDPNGRLVHKHFVQATSSVMEYMSLRDEMHLQFDWEPYDEAALVYAYSSDNPSKKVDLSQVNSTQYLFCTDEHRILNAMCNPWDHGSTPTEIVKSLVESYEDRYRSSNLRYDRAYWNTSGYPARIFRTMFQMKKFLLLWRAAFNDNNIQDKLGTKLGIDESEEIREISDPIRMEMVQAVKLVVAFYNSVIQQSSSDRHWRDEFDPFTGEQTRIGIIWDKIFAMMFLMGDESFAYNPNQRFSYASFLSYIQDSEGLYSGFGNLMEKILENMLTVRVDMEPWFIGFGRTLYALNAYNLVNLSNSQLIHKIRVACYSPETFKDQLGIDPNKFVDPGKADAQPEILDSTLLDMTKMEPDQIKDDYFSLRHGTARLGIVKVDGKYYVTHETRNAVAFNIIWNMIQQAKRFGGIQNRDKDDILEIFRLYHLVVHRKIPECS